MGLPVTIFSSDDVGAPIGAFTKPSEIIAILKACLVDGYGTKLPLGWTLAHEDVATVQAVFKNSTTDGGSGGSVQVGSHNLTDGVGQSARFTCANQIIGVGEFINKCGYLTITTNHTNVSGWFLIGTSRGFYLKIRSKRLTVGSSPNSNEYDNCFMLFIGDIDSYVPNDMGVFTMLSNNIDPILNNSNIDYQSSGLGCVGRLPKCQLYSTDGSNQSVAYQLFSTINSIFCENLPTIDAESIGIPIDLLPCPVVLNSQTSVVNPMCRGVIPGLYSTRFVGFRGKPVPIFFNFNNINYYMDDTAYVSIYLIQTSGEWYA